MDDRLRERLTCVIPAKDEAPTISEVINGAFKFVSEVIVVDGHSRDRTRDIAESEGAKLFLDHKLGKGEALRCVIPHVKTEFVVFIDADGSHDVNDIPKLIEPLVAGTHDLVVASRLIGGSSELHGGFDEFIRLAGSSFVTASINTRFRTSLSDTQNGFRAARTEILKSFHLQDNHTTIEQEMIIKALRLNYRVGEVPSHEHRRKFGRSHIVLWRDSPRYLASLLHHLFVPRSSPK